MSRTFFRGAFARAGVQRFLAVFCVLLIAPGDAILLAQEANAPTAPAAARIPPEQLDSLVAPIALYPDPMLSQTLVASTYPLEVIQLQQWLEKNPGLKDKALADAVAKQGWDASIQAMAALPTVVKQMAENLKWTTDLGNAFLAQQVDVMDAVQRMRKKAQDAGHLKSTEQQKVETKVVENKTVVVVEQAKTEVVYVPSYNPTVVYGPPVYPYPPIAYPPPGYYAAGMAISFGVGVAMGAMWSGGWGWGCGWGHNDIDINVNNNFNRNTNVSRGGNTINTGGNTLNRGGNTANVGNTKWQHNPQHRGGAPYSDRATANRYGGSARGDSMESRRAAANRQTQGARAGTMDRGASQRAGTMDRSASGSRAGTMDRSAGGRDSLNRGSSAGVSDRSTGGDRVGNRQVSSGSREQSAFSGGSGGFSGSSARASSSRGSSSVRSSGRSSGGGRSGGGRRR
jgi:hypothetical protein